MCETDNRENSGDEDFGDIPPDERPIGEGFEDDGEDDIHRGHA